MVGLGVALGLGLGLGLAKGGVALLVAGRVLVGVGVNWLGVGTSGGKVGNGSVGARVGKGGVGGSCQGRSIACNAWGRTPDSPADSKAVAATMARGPSPSHARQLRDPIGAPGGT